MTVRNFVVFWAARTKNAAAGSGDDSERRRQHEREHRPRETRRGSPHLLTLCVALGITHPLCDPSLFCRATDVSHDVPRSLAFRRGDLHDALIHVVVLQAKCAAHGCV